MNRVLLQPASGSDASEHYTLTMDPGVSISILETYVSGFDLEKLKSLGFKSIKTWGFIPTPDGDPPSHWINLEENDSVVFYKKGKLYFSV